MFLHNQEQEHYELNFNRDHIFYKAQSASDKRARSKKSMRLPKMDFRRSVNLEEHP